MTVAWWNSGTSLATTLESISALIDATSTYSTSNETSKNEEAK